MPLFQALNEIQPLVCKQEHDIPNYNTKPNNLLSQQRKKYREPLTQVMVGTFTAAQRTSLETTHTGIKKQA